VFGGLYFADLMVVDVAWSWMLNLNTINQLVTDLFHVKLDVKLGRFVI